MPPYVDPTEQLVTEILVADIKRSVRFYLELGFALLRDGGDFVGGRKKGRESFLTLMQFDKQPGFTPRDSRPGCGRGATRR